MSVVIGAGTTVVFDPGACAVSVSWGYSPNPQRLYCLGSWTPWSTIQKPTENLSITVYADGTGSHSITPTNACANANMINASVDATICGIPVASVSGDWFVSGYNYSKEDPIGPGQESWSLTRWVAGGGTPAPTYTLRGIAEGQASHESGVINSGVVFTGTPTEATSGNVSAGSVGRAYTTYVGTVITIGGGTGIAGETGTASVSIPYTPLWI